MPKETFAGRRVLVLESRRAAEMGQLVRTYGGLPVSAPALREVPLHANPEALDCIAALIRGDVDLLVLLTGVGTRAFVQVAEHGDREALMGAMARTRIAARGPKPVAALRELGLRPWVTAPEPNTWPDLVLALDDRVGRDGLRGWRVAVQEYGVPAPELVTALEERGAVVTRVPVYRWALPEDLAPLAGAVDGIVEGRFDVVLFTTQVQVAHLLEVAGGRAADVREGLRRIVVASIGPTTSEALRQLDVPPDIEPSHPKMGFLVQAAAARAEEVAAAKLGAGGR